MKILPLPRERALPLGFSPVVMGIINCTPDSFFTSSRSLGVENAVRAARAMVSDGADVLDIGGESSRPGSEYVEAGEELSRVVPVIRAIRSEFDIPISIDTRKFAVAEGALDAGADIVNDISALRDDPDLMALVVERRVPVILMHMRGNPKTMQSNPVYADTIGEISAELVARVDAALEAGVAADRIVIDPGIGFGKTVDDNVAILAGIGDFRRLGYPVVVGLSRKSFLGALIGGSPAAEERRAATIAAHTIAALSGAEILRVHDVRDTVDAIRVVAAYRAVAVPEEPAR